MLASVCAGAQTSLDPGTRRIEGGFRELADRLVEQPDDAAFGPRLSELIDSASEMRQIEFISEVLLPLVRDQALLARSAKQLARIAMTARDYELADTLFETAYVASGREDLECLYAQAQALLQLGRLAAAEQRAVTIIEETGDDELERRARALLARAMHLRGRHADASRLLALLLAPDDPADVDPDALLLQSSVLVARDVPGVAPLEQLVRMHPASVASRMVSGNRVEEARLPVMLVTGPRDRLPEPMTDRSPSTVAARTDEPRVTAIQVGSFSNRDNAVHLTADLRKLGFNARSEPVDRDGRRFELVLVAVAGGSSEDAARTLAALRAAGYDGFRIY